MREMINPRLFTPAVRKVRWMHRPKFYLAGLQLQGVFYELKNGSSKTHSAAEAYSRKALARWIRLHDVAIAALVQESAV